MVFVVMVVSNARLNTSLALGAYTCVLSIPSATGDLSRFVSGTPSSLVRQPFFKTKFSLVKLSFAKERFMPSGLMRKRVATLLACKQQVN